MSGYVISLRNFLSRCKLRTNDLKVRVLITLFMFTAKRLKFLQQKTVSNFVMRFRCYSLNSEPRCAPVKSFEGLKRHQ